MAWDQVGNIRGPQGLTGAQGNPGQTGDTGSPGPPGNPGAPGANGNTTHAGAGAPDISLGNVGDLYIDTVTGDLMKKQP